MPDNSLELIDKWLIKQWTESSAHVEAEIAAAKAKHQSKSSTTEPVSALSPKDVT
ncbi:hypothetical protein [Synechococcus sp. KORDI-52]|uniref:hypothetical protein n=1 Tax=Synechococcus sp. KORDI-52 TaxID=585425 RepID=UPI0012EB3CEB|nr:hypothetical protein [Synechococcus sp. KORDI-52]